MMKKILFGILMLFLVALVPSVSAATTCSSTGSDLGISDYALTFQRGTYVRAGDDIDLDIDLENLGGTDITVANIVLTFELYDSTISTVIDSDNTQTLTGAATIVALATESFTATYTLPNSGLTDHNYVLYIMVDDTVLLNCDVTSGDTVVVNEAPSIGSISNKVVNEDEALSFTFTANDPDSVTLGDTLTYSLSVIPSGTVPSGLSVTGTSTGGTIIWTPRNEHVGLHNLAVTAKDGYGGETTRTFAVTVVNTNDKPTLPTLSTENVQEDIAISDIIVLDSTKAASVDVDVGDIAIYSLSIVSAPDESTFAQGYLYDNPATTTVEKIITGWSGWDPVTRTIGGWTPDKGDIGELKLRLTATDMSLATGTADFTINVYPKTMCELGEIGNVLDITIDSPDDGDDFGPGDKINIEVTVDNSAADDKDVIVEALLYDIETQKKIADVESDDENIDEDEDYKFELELQIPLDDDEDYKGDYVLFIKAYEDGKEDEQCLGNLIELDIGRESHEVIIQSMTITPSTLEPGDSFDVLIRALNTGRKDELGVTVKLRSTDLEIDETSDARDLAAYDESGNSYVYRFTDIKIPSSTRGKTYQLEAFVLYEDGATSTSYMDSPAFRLRNSQIVVEGEAILTDTISVGSVEETAEGVLRIPVTVTNTEGKTGLTVGLTNINWAKEVDEQAISLVKGDSGTVYFDLELEDAEEGTESFTVQFKSNGEVIDSAARSIELTDDMLGNGFFGSIKGSTVLWVIGDIVLIVVAIFFVKLIFTARKKKLDIREVKL